MARSARLFLCARCRDQVLLCSHCDRGQVYCSRACSFARRGELRRETAQRYQSSQAGRLKHAARSACWRKRRRSLRQTCAGADIDKVTHQGCPPALADASLHACDMPTSACEFAALTETAQDAAVAMPGALSFAAPVCRRCAHSLLPRVRLSWLRRNSGRPRSHHDHPT
jgi:anti-sigma factor RsiW